jgi:hypothetical protein
MGPTSQRTEKQSDVLTTSLHQFMASRLSTYKFGCVRNSRITTVFGIKITVMYSNVNLLFQNSENNCYSAILW